MADPQTTAPLTGVQRCQNCGGLIAVGHQCTCSSVKVADPTTWREANTITDWEFSEIGALLCDHAPRDLALMIVRLQESHRIGEETYSDLRQMREQMYIMWKQLKAAQEDIRKLKDQTP